jgi:hypothetical protein
MIQEVIDQRTPVVRHEDSVLLFRPHEQFRVLDAFRGVRWIAHIYDVDQREGTHPNATAERFGDCAMRVFVKQK